MMGMFLNVLTATLVKEKEKGIQQRRLTGFILTCEISYVLPYSNLMLMTKIYCCRSFAGFRTCEVRRLLRALTAPL